MPISGRARPSLVQWQWSSSSAAFSMWITRRQFKGQGKRCTGKPGCWSQAMTVGEWEQAKAALHRGVPECGVVWEGATKAVEVD